MAQSAISVIERFLAEIVNGGRAESAPELIAAEPLRPRVAAFNTAFPDLRASVVRVVADDHLVAVHLVASGTHNGVFQGAPPTGRAWSSSCTAIYEVSDGRIVDFWVNWDMLDILEQLGVVQRAAGTSA
jgi:steroid delta-isomerase-like uncharacterized protein